MLQHKGWFLPEGEEHQQQLIDSEYELRKYKGIIEKIKGRGLALDVGAHIGQWTVYMSQDFSEVLAFEPMRDHIMCWLKNVGYYGKKDCPTRLIEVALGSFANKASVSAATPGNTGTTFMKLGEGDIEVDFLDNLVDHSKEVSFLKIDVEGLEFDVLRGAMGIITKWKPAILFEEKGHQGKYGVVAGEARRFLEARGYKLEAVLGSDFFMVAK